jgi:acyl-CoA hydrolase
MDTAGLERLIRPGARVVVADGCGAPRALLPALNEVARAHGDLRLVLGWLPVEEPDLHPELYADVRAFMSGWGLRRRIDAGEVAAVRCRLSAVPSLLAGPLRPDLLLASVVRRGAEYFLGTESAWTRGLIEAGVPVAAVVARCAPAAEAGPPLPMDSVTILAEVDDRPREIRVGEPGETERSIAAHAARLVPVGCRVQLAAGRLGAALLDAIEVPVAVDSGLLPDAVVRLEQRGLLLSTPIAAYLAGSAVLHDWADGRGVLHPLEFTHDPGRLSNGLPLVALNTAVEIDLDGQVNAEGTEASIVGGIGGHPDYTAAAARSRDGLSVIAMPSTHEGRPTLVQRLSRPVTTPAHDVDVVVTERGAADLRGLSREERTAALRRLWDS